LWVQHEGDWRTARVSWWPLYLIAALLVGVTALVETFVDSDAARKVLETTAALAGFGLIWAWLRHQRITLELERGRRRP